MVPLSVLLDGEMRRLIGRDRSPSLAAWTGNHPYLIKLLLHYMDGEVTRTTEPWSRPWRRGGASGDLFVRCLAAEIGEGPSERVASATLDRARHTGESRPSLGPSTGIRDIKAVSDTLVYLGVISRWIRNEEATLFAGCRLLNDFITAEAKNSCPTP